MTWVYNQGPWDCAEGIVRDRAQSDRLRSEDVAVLPSLKGIICVNTVLAEPTSDVVLRTHDKHIEVQSNTKFDLEGNLRVLN